MSPLLRRIFPILVAFAALSLGALAGERLPPNEVLPRLSGPHGAQWPADYAPSEKERAEVFGLLRNAVEQSRERAENGTSPVDRRIADQALREAGKFAVDDSGQLLGNAREFYERELSRGDLDRDGQVALYQSLANTGTPEAVRWLLDRIGEDSTGYFALAQVDDLWSESGVGEGYHPNVGKPIARRTRREEWEALRDPTVKKLREWAGRAAPDDPRIARAARLTAALTGKPGAPAAQSSGADRPAASAGAVVSPGTGRHAESASRRTSNAGGYIGSAVFAAIAIAAFAHQRRRSRR